MPLKKFFGYVYLIILSEPNPAAWSRTLTVTLHSRIASVDPTYQQRSTALYSFLRSGTCDDGQVSTPTPAKLGYSKKTSKASTRSDGAHSTHYAHSRRI